MEPTQQETGKLPWPPWRCFECMKDFISEKALKAHQKNTGHWKDIDYDGQEEGTNKEAN